MKTAKHAFGYLPVALAGNALMRVAGGAGGILVGLYFAELARTGRIVESVFIGLLGAIVYMAELAGAIPLGMLSDRFSPRALVIAGSLIGAAGAQLLAIDQAVQTFFIARSLEGLAAGAQAPGILSHITGVTEASGRRGRIMSMFELSLLAGIALGAPVGSELWGRFGTDAFTAIAIVYLVSAICFAVGVTSRSVSKTSTPLRGLMEALRHPSVRGLVPAWLCMNAVVGFWLGPVVTYLLTREPESEQYLDGLYSRTPEHVGWLLLGYTIVFGAGVLIWSAVIDRVRRKTVLATGLAAMMVVCGLLYLLNHSQSWTTGGRQLLIAFAAGAVMVESGFTPAALALLGDAVKGQYGTGATMGVYSALLGAGALSGSLLAGMAAGALAVDGLIIGTVALAAVAAIAVWRLPEPDRTTIQT